ncbi:MAG TPA: hypothetical protein VD931_10415 [Baekduia sp.]|nr:hypothetical protein [Baekduia sp.]
MTIAITDAQRAVIYQLMDRPGAWGGPTLLTQDALYTTLRLNEFEGVEQVDLGKLGKVTHDFHLEPDAIAMLRAFLALPGQPRLTGRVAASLLRSL